MIKFNQIQAFLSHLALLYERQSKSSLYHPNANGLLLLKTG